MANQDGTAAPDPWQMRASDADREKYVAHLQTAYAEGRLSHEEYDQRMTVAYEAVTFADLYPLLTDLPVDVSDIPLPPLPASQQLAVSGAREVVSRRSVTVDTSPTVAVLSETDRGGRWVVPAKQVSVAVLGTVSLDLQDALLDAGSVEIRAVAVLGEIRITVPDDIRVEVTGAGILGEFLQIDERSGVRRGQDAPPGAPLVRITGAAVLGTVRVEVVSAANGPNAPTIPGAQAPTLPMSTGGASDGGIDRGSAAESPPITPPPDQDSSVIQQPSPTSVPPLNLPALPNLPEPPVPPELPELPVPPTPPEPPAGGGAPTGAG